jgi:hypothetical protein
MESNPITKEWIKVFDSLNEPQKRWFAATKSIELGYGGVSKVSRATGLSRTTIIQGCHELTNQKSLNDSEPIFRTLKFHFSRFNFISTYCYST